MTASRKGWRVFMCKNCGWEGAIATRDRHSPSGENCPNPWCSEIFFMERLGSLEDETLATDNSGNLTGRIDDLIRKAPVFALMPVLPPDYFSQEKSPWARAPWKGTWYRFERVEPGAEWFFAS